jgi:hypothetical protein
MVLAVDTATSGDIGLPGRVDAREVAERAAACSSVARLSGGVVGEVATYLPGSRVPGVRVAAGFVEVHVVSRWDVPVAALAAEVRAAVAPAARGVEVAVFVDDIELPALHQEGRQS